MLTIMTDNMTNDSMTNDKPTMKVYTEEKLREAIQMADKHHYLLASEESEIIESLNPIELPTWDDVKKAIELARRCWFSNAGIDWKISDEEIIEQLKGGGNK